MACHWYDPLSYGNCARDVAKAAAGDAFHSIAESFGKAADHAVNWLWSQMSAATAVQLGGPGFVREIAMTAAIGGTVALGLFVLQLIGSVLRRDPGGLARACKGLVVAFVGGAVAIGLVNVALGATDELSAGVVRMATGTNLAGLGKLVIGATALTTAVTGSASLLVLSLGCIVATLAVYAALVVRKVLIVVTAVFAPIAFAGSLADITVSWTRRWIETTVALVVSKLILVLIFVTGYEILVEGAGQSGTGAAQKVTQVISGVIVLLLAGFAPWVALKMVQFTGGHAQQLRVLSSNATGGLAATGRMAQKAAPYVARAATGGASSAGAAGGAGGAGGAGAGAGEMPGGGPAGGGAASGLDGDPAPLSSATTPGTSAGESPGAPGPDVAADPTAADDPATGGASGDGSSAAAPASRPGSPDMTAPYSTPSPEEGEP